jgi:hypothetical protein
MTVKMGRMAGLVLAFAAAATGPAMAYDLRDEPSILRHEEEMRQDQQRYERDHRPAPSQSDGIDSDLFELGIEALLGGAIRQQEAAPHFSDPIVTPMAAICPGQWDSPECLNLIASASAILSARYSETLDRSGYGVDAEAVRTACDQTARQDGGQSAMVEAFRVCNNAVIRAGRHTGIVAGIMDHNRVSGPLLCLDRLPRCDFFLNALAEFR